MWKKLLTVSLIFAVSVVILIMLSLYSFQRFDAFVRYTEATERHHALLSELSMLRVRLTEMENNQRAFLLFEDSTLLSRYKMSEIQVKQVFSTIHERTKGQADQQRRIRSLNLLIKSRIDFLETGLIMGYPSTDYKKGSAYMERCIDLITEMENAENLVLKEIRESKEFYQTTTPNNFRIVFILTMTVFAISFGLLIQQYRGRFSYQQKLERNIVELNQANAEWEQITHAASHDLQEPLRKIRTFSGILQSRYIDQLDDEGKTLVKRIDVASSRAQSLMNDIVNYNLVVYPREDLSPVDLKQKFNDALATFHKIVEDKKVNIFADELPLIRAYPTQIELMFKCLIDNSLKFSKPDEPLKLTIAASIIHHRELPMDQPLSFSHYHKIVFEDNGIGFENQFSDKIFKMFQRLHPQESEYDGRGIGLAIVKRILTNHMGMIIGRGRPGKGAKFTLYFPVR
jgi:signal transduction histidine kinase